MLFPGHFVRAPMISQFVDACRTLLHKVGRARQSNEYKNQMKCTVCRIKRVARTTRGFDALKVFPRSTGLVGGKNFAGLGFTLMEMLLAVAIMGVLSAIAIPAYTSHIENAKNKLAINYLLAIETEIERYYTREFHYPDALTEIAATLPNNGKDPWGRDFVYLNIIDGSPGAQGHARKDHALHPINTRYDLYSLGKDGVTMPQISHSRSLDDIILARDGGFVGLAADF